MTFQYLEIEKVIGYRFIDKGLLLQAFTHKSFSNEHAGYPSYERLEFLGDSVLGLTVSDYLYRHDGGEEGRLTVKKSEMVSTEPLFEQFSELGLISYILLGKGASNYPSPSICEDVFEAIIGAIYLDGGLEKSKTFIYNTLLSSYERNKSWFDFFDYKSLIKNHCEKNKLGEVCFVDVDKIGPDHEPTFIVSLLIGDKEVAVGQGKTKQKAQQDAAKTAAIKLKNEGVNLEF